MMSSFTWATIGRRLFRVLMKVEQPSRLPSGQAGSLSHPQAALISFWRDFEIPHAECPCEPGGRPALRRRLPGLGHHRAEAQRPGPPSLHGQAPCAAEGTHAHGQRRAVCASMPSWMPSWPPIPPATAPSAGTTSARRSMAARI